MAWWVNTWFFVGRERSEIWGLACFQIALPKSADFPESLSGWYPFGSDFGFQVVNLAQKSQPNTA
jgi:hypothetical protein